jgi:hypothetical protein
MSCYIPPDGYRRAQSIVLHDDNKYIDVHVPDSELEDANFCYYIHPFYEIHPKYLYGIGLPHEVCGERRVHDLYIRMELNGAISIIIIEQSCEIDDAPLWKRELTYCGKYSIYWGAQEVTA